MNSGETFGGLLVGALLNTYLYGVVTYQFAAYHQTKFGDPRWVKCMVLFLFVVDTFHSVAVIYLALGAYNDPGSSLNSWPFQFDIVGVVLVALPTHLFLGIRIWQLTHSKILYYMVFTMSISLFSLGMACGVTVWVLLPSPNRPNIQPLLIVWLSMQVVVDTFITSTLAIVFFRLRSGLRRSETVINRLIRGAIQTGLFAGIFSIALITYLVLPVSVLSVFAIPAGRVYTNTLMDTLLCREWIRAKMAVQRVPGVVSGPTHANGRSSSQPTETSMESTQNDVA